jgi:hypothetical protein
MTDCSKGSNRSRRVLSRQRYLVGCQPPAEYEKAPTWVAGNDGPLGGSEIIRIPATRR